MTSTRFWTWTLHVPSDASASGVNASNGTLVFPGVKKYDTVDLMPKGESNYASFLGEDGNGLWGLNDNEQLVWLGA